MTCHHVLNYKYLFFCCKHWKQQQKHSFILVFYFQMICITLIILKCFKSTRLYFYLKTFRQIYIYLYTLRLLLVDLLCPHSKGAFRFAFVRPFFVEKWGHFMFIIWNWSTLFLLYFLWLFCLNIVVIINVIIDRIYLK